MPSTYTLISSNVLGSSAASVTFSAIPSTYTDLVLRMSLRISTTDAIDGYLWTINGNTSSNYSQTYLLGWGNSVTSGRFTRSGFLEVYTDANTATSNTFGSHEIYIPNYAVSSYKQISSLNMQENNTTQAFIGALSNLYSSTTPISSLSFTPLTGPNFLSGSSFYLYGIKSSGTV